MAKRTAKDFSRKEIWEIATTYANTGLAYTHEYFETEYKMSKGTFYTILDKAVVESVVNAEVVQLMAAKAARNSEIKASKAGQIRSIKHYEDLWNKRIGYMFQKNQAIDWTIKYAESNLPRDSFCRAECISKRLLNRTIYKAIIEGWVSNEVVEKLENKSLKNNGGEKTEEFWKKITQFRENKKNQG